MTLSRACTGPEAIRVLFRKRKSTPQILDPFARGTREWSLPSPISNSNLQPPTPSTNLYLPLVGTAMRRYSKEERQTLIMTREQILVIKSYNDWVSTCLYAMLGNQKDLPYII